MRKLINQIMSWLGLQATPQPAPYRKVWRPSPEEDRFVQAIRDYQWGLMQARPNPLAEMRELFLVVDLTKHADLLKEMVKKWKASGVLPEDVFVTVTTVPRATAGFYSATSGALMLVYSTLKPHDLRRHQLGTRLRGHFSQVRFL
jgi:hypothetical protein